LYALALFLYSLQPPPNPHKFDEVAGRRKEVFTRSGCAMCQTSTRGVPQCMSVMKAPSSSAASTADSLARDITRLLRTGA
jgi:hypothetical protein